MNDKCTEQRFLDDVAQHQMTILRDDGVSRHVQFKSGGTYHYKGVPAMLYEGLLAAESAGKFINSEVKGIYEFVKIAEVAA